MRKLLPVFLILLLAGSAGAQEWARKRIEQSPRHLESVKVSYADRTVNTFVAYPEKAEKATVVVLIHEIFGLTDWVRLQADDLAKEGYIVVAPDLLTGMGPDGGGTDAFADSTQVRSAIRELKPSQVTADLKAVADYGRKLPASNGKVVVGGFCWGGTQTFDFATQTQDIEAAFVFYGTAPKEPALKKITAPVYGFYAENDARVNATLEETTAAMKKLGKSYQPEIYKGAGHGFMRAGVTPEAEPGNREAHEKAWRRWLGILEKI